MLLLVCFLHSGVELGLSSMREPSRLLLESDLEGPTVQANAVS